MCRYAPRPNQHCIKPFREGGKLWLSTDQPFYCLDKAGFLALRYGRSGRCNVRSRFDFNYRKRIAAACENIDFADWRF
jgi:hypothetical protein